jgi:hypothetical protein
LASYTYSAIEKYDSGALHAAILADPVLSAAGLDGVSLSVDEGFQGQLTVFFTGELDVDGISLLRRLVMRIASMTALYELSCGVCERTYQIAACGRPVYCRSCGEPFLAECPSGKVIWSDPSNQLRRWAIVQAFVSFSVRLEEAPEGGIELFDVVVQNAAVPVVTDVRSDGFQWSAQVGVVSAMWEDTKVQFSWRAVL